jgi:glycosyltransferase involved in cell wall biosynthesis
VRILYIVTAYPRWPGDVITPWLTETITRLGDRGVEVEVLAPSYRGLADQVIEGTRVHRFRYAPAAAESLTHDQTTPDRIRDRPAYVALVPGYLVAGMLAAARLARRGGFDVVHAFWPLPHGLFGIAAHAISGTPLVSTFFGVELRWLRKQLPFLAPIVRWIVRRSDAVTVISRHTERELLRLEPATPVVRIPFGAATTLPDREAKPKGSSGDGSFRILFVGRLVERKGVSYLLRAIAELRDRSAITLTVVGEGPLLPRLRVEADRLGISDLVEFTGLVSEAELSERFESCDAFVLPAVEDAKGDVEGLGIVLLEAILHGRPVIASDSGGIADIVVDGVSGLLTRPADVYDLVAAIERLMDDADLRSRLVTGGRRHVDENFSWDRITDDLIALYERVAADRDAARGRKSR